MSSLSPSYLPLSFLCLSPLPPLLLPERREAEAADDFDDQGQEKCHSYAAVEREDTA